MIQRKAFLGSLFLWFLSLVSCEVNREGEEIINRAITVHGGEQYQHARISFDFRDRHYIATRQYGQFKYERIFTDSTGQNVHDILTNENFTRKINQKEVALSEEDQKKYSNSVNSVIYFALLPFFLNDPAVNKELLAESAVKGEPYYKIKVTFNQEEGGKDYEDEFVYWIHQENYTMDYLSYRYYTDGGGTRFREAYNIRGINGIRFADYVNYESAVGDFALENYDQLLEEDKLKELSRIELQNIKVENIAVENIPS